MPRIFGILFISAIALGACATPTTTYSIASKSGVGFQDQKIESNRYSVVFTGDTDASLLLVEKFAMRRAAEVTLNEGQTWFRIVSQATSRVGGTQNQGTNVGVTAGGGSRGSGVGLGIGFDLTPTRNAYESRIEIILGTGSFPPNAEERVYDAKSVLENSQIDTMPAQY